MKAAKVPYLKKAQSHFNKAMRLSGERDGIDHACAEIAGYIGRASGRRGVLGQ